MVILFMCDCFSVRLALLAGTGKITNYLMGPGPPLTCPIQCDLLDDIFSWLDLLVISVVGVRYTCKSAILPTVSTAKGIGLLVVLVANDII